MKGGEKRMYKDVLFSFDMFQATFLLLDIYILSKTGRDITRKDEHTWFCVLIVTHMVYLVCNTVWTMHEYDLLELPRALLMLVCSLSLWSVINCATSFFLFVTERREVEFFRTFTGRVLRLVPAGIATALILLNPWTGLVFTLDAEEYFVHEALYLPTIVVASLYLVAVAVIGAVAAMRARTSFKRRSSTALCGSVLLIMLYIVLDSFMNKASILPAAVFAVIVVIFILMQESSINSDALTGMNNRRKADDYLSERLTRVSAADPLYLYIGDLNGFKKINDTYGHVEGDKALIRCSLALKRTIAHFNGFAARFGGDEFLMTRQPGGDADPEELIRDLTERLNELSEDLPYELAMTVGYTVCTDPAVAMSDCIRRADEMLYERKTRLRVGR